MSRPTVPPPSAVKRLDFVVAPGGRLTGQIRVPGDKSISHRALMLAALAEGETHISGFLESDDCHRTLTALQALGVSIQHVVPGEVTVRGTGKRSLHAARQPLDLGNSGTAMRLLAGLLCGQPFVSVLTGDESLRRRPMARIIEPLAQMGAVIESTQACAPLTVHGRRPLKPLRYAMPLASAQVKSALLLAGLYADGETWLHEPATSRDHTERMLAAFGCECLRADGWLGLRGGTVLHGAAMPVPGDLSSAGFFLAGAAMVPGTRLMLENVGVNPTRTGIISLLRDMGADIRLHNPRLAGKEPLADMEIAGNGLHGIDIDSGMVPLAIDEFPALLVAAACAEGVTTLRGAAELRVKESDRLAAMATGLRTLGVAVDVWDDGMRVRGTESFAGGAVTSNGDHRIAMAFAMAGLRARSAIRIRDCRNVDTSFPGFAAIARAAGLSISVQEAAFP